MVANILILTVSLLISFSPSSNAQAQSFCTCTECPAQPLDRCDFYFAGELYPAQQFGNATEVPVFALDAASGDHAIGTPILDAQSVSFVEVDRAGNASFLCATGNCLAGEQFYATLYNGKTYVMVRTFNQPPLSFFESRCVIFPLYSLEIVLKTGETINLNPGDNNPLYPEDRRCVVFRTGPSPPQPGNCCNSSIQAPPTPAGVGLQNPPPPVVPLPPRAASLRPPFSPTPSAPPPTPVQSPSPQPGTPSPTPSTPFVPRTPPSSSQSFSPPQGISSIPSSTPPPPGPRSSQSPRGSPVAVPASPSPSPPAQTPPSFPPPTPSASTPAAIKNSPPPQTPNASPPPTTSSPPPSAPTSSPPLTPLLSPPSTSSTPTAGQPPPSPGSPPPGSIPIASPPPPAHLILPNAPPPPPASTFCVSVCPSSPTALCDFFFTGFENKVPSFHLEGNSSVDQVISGTSFIAEISVSSQNLEVDATNSPVQVLSCPEPTAVSAINSQFYVVGSPAKLYARTFQAIPGVQYFENRCYLLPITDFAVVVNGSTINLSPGDNNTAYPESYRCVVFTTEA